MSEVHRLVYVSAAREEVTTATLDQILNVAQTNNRTADVTGLLLFHDGSFFQVLEGPSEQVQRIFAAIERDPRHARVLVMQDKASVERCFPGWSMGYVQPQAMKANQKQGLLDLRQLIGGEQRDALSSSPSVSVLIDSFLSSFREFA